MKTVKSILQRAAILLGLASIALCAGIFYFANFQYGWQFAYAHDLLKVKALIERDPAIVNSYPDGSTPLHYAAAQGNLEIAKYLVEHGAEVTRVNERGITAEQWAQQNHHLETVNYLKTICEEISGKTN